MLRQGLILTSIAICTCTLLTSRGLAQDVGGVRAPEIHAKTLSGAAVDVPARTGSRSTVILIGFSKSSGDQVRHWGERLALDEPDAAKSAYYEVAELEEVPRLLRGLVARQIQGAVSPRGQAHFVTLFDHAADWKKVAGFNRAEDAYVLVIDPSGTVRWRTSGEVSDSKFAALKRSLSQR